MDRTCITRNRLSLEYNTGVTDFLNFTILNAENRMSIRYPSTFCCNMKFHTPQQVKDRLFEKCFLTKYRVCIWHGEIDIVSTSTKCQDHQHNQRFRCHDYKECTKQVPVHHSSMEGSKPS